MHDGTASSGVPVFRGRAGRRFDYDSLPPEHVRVLKEAFIQISLCVGGTAKAIVAIGRELLAVKALLDRGQFVRWVEAECVFSLRSAQNYMRVARFMDQQNATFANLPPATLYMISAKKAPPEFVSEVVALAKTSGVIYHADIVQRFKDYKSHKQGTKTEQHEVNACDVVPEGNGRVERISFDAEQSRFVNESARNIFDKFGEDGVRFLLGLRGNLMEALAVLEQEITELDEKKKGDLH
jgi:Protein of unknown function (DUF3102)